MLQQRYSPNVDFLTIYIKEAHPEDEWQLAANEKEGVCFIQPTSLGQRIHIANLFVEQYDYQLPMVVDSMQDEVNDAFAAWPERLYVLESDGTVAYKGDVGPFGFNPDELEQWLTDRFA